MEGCRASSPAAATTSGPSGRSATTWLAADAVQAKRLLLARLRLFLLAKRFKRAYALSASTYSVT
jgi:hypothetical protein